MIRKNLEFWQFTEADEGNTAKRFSRWSQYRFYQVSICIFQVALRQFIAILDKILISWQILWFLKPKSNRFWNFYIFLSKIKFAGTRISIIFSYMEALYFRLYLYLLWDECTLIDFILCSDIFSYKMVKK